MSDHYFSAISPTTIPLHTYSLVVQGAAQGIMQGWLCGHAIPELHSSSVHGMQELVASRMRTSCATILKTGRARLDFVACGSASVTACAVCLIAFLQAWTVAFLVCLLFIHLIVSSWTLIKRYTMILWLQPGPTRSTKLRADHSGQFLMFEAR
jgi:CHASE2 domain-containing sensor protein